MPNPRNFIKYAQPDRSVVPTISCLPYEWYPVLEVQDSPRVVWDFEKGFRKMFKNYAYRPAQYFYGLSECISGISLQDIYSKLR